MRKFIVMLLACLMIVSFALADDLSSMTIDELRQLQNEINAEIRSRPEWKEVTIPSGTWIVGKDIPAGEYCIKIGKEGFYVSVKRPNKYGTTDLIVNQGITSENKIMGRVELYNDDIVNIEHGKAVFAPAISLGF